MAYENILVEKKNAIAYVTVNRPKVLNALNMATMEDLRSAFHDLKNDAQIRVVILTGTGDVLEPEDGIIGLGSGGNYARAAARALIGSELSAEEIAKRSLDIAADICVYTNHNIVVEKLDAK